MPSDPINAGSPESPPAPQAIRRGAGGRGRLARVLRLVLAGSLVIGLLDPAHLDQWSESRPLLAQSSVAQAMIEDLDRGLAAIGFSQAYEWLRRQTRTLQGLRFNAGTDNRQ